MNIIPLFSFLAGVASILSPCILPIIPVLIAYFLAKKKKIEIISFILGIFSIFLLFIILTIMFTAAINQYLMYIRVIASLILITLGTSILLNKNILNITWPTYNFDSIGKNKDNENRSTLKLAKSSYVMGLLTSLAWAPCYGTYLISLISFSVSTGNIFYSGVNLIIYTLGFGLSLFVIGFLISTVNIQKLINKGDLINRISGILIIIGGIYLLWIQFFGY